MKNFSSVFLSVVVVAANFVACKRAPEVSNVLKTDGQKIMTEVEREKAGLNLGGFTGNVTDSAAFKNGKAPACDPTKIRIARPSDKGKQNVVAFENARSTGGAVLKGEVLGTFLECTAVCLVKEGSGSDYLVRVGFETDSARNHSVEAVVDRNLLDVQECKANQELLAKNARYAAAISAAEKRQQQYKAEQAKKNLENLQNGLAGAGREIVKIFTGCEPSMWRVLFNNGNDVPVVKPAKSLGGTELRDHIPDCQKVCISKYDANKEPVLVDGKVQIYGSDQTNFLLVERKYFKGADYTCQ